jgi:hypothetical protein
LCWRTREPIVNGFSMIHTDDTNREGRKWSLSA